MSSKNIYQRVNAVMKAATYVKRGSAGQGTGVLYDEVIAQLQPLLVEHGIVVTVDFIADTSRENSNGGYIYEGFFAVHYVNIDQPDDRITCNIVAHAQNPGDKSPGIAITYATKISHVKVFGIETGINDESRNAVEDITEAADRLRAATDIESLQAAFIQGYRAHSDTKARLELTEIKDAMKKELSSGD